jgi:hypothetical protein
MQKDSGTRTHRSSSNRESWATVLRVAAGGRSERCREEPYVSAY